MPEMNCVYIKAFSLDEAWRRCMWEVVKHGHDYKIDRGSFEGQHRKEFDFITVQITNPGVRPLSPVVPEGFTPPASDEYIEKYFCEYLFGDFKKPEEDYTYGQRLINPIASLGSIVNKEELRIKNVNQMEEVIRMYKEDGHGTNQATMEIAMPFDILLKDPPCLRLIDTRIRYGKLHFAPVYFRSWDLFGGFPSNLGALQLQKEYMAEQIGVEDGELIACSKGLHLYDHCWELGEMLKLKDEK